MTEPTKIPLPDDVDRRRAEEEYLTPHLVEASAGTGKTRTLIRRILWMVKEGGLPLSKIAAMTFTEKAAGEMKGRLREALEEEIPKETIPERRLALEEARRNVESAEISTIHSFCASLLREQPVEAGVDPEFTATDGSLAETMLAERFPAWLDREARAAGSPLARALEAGASPAGILELAGELLKDRTLLEGTTLPSDPLVEARLEIDELIARFETALDGVGDASHADPKAVQVADGLQELLGLRGLPLEGLASWSPATEFNFRKGSHKAHEPKVKAALAGCKDAFKELPDRLQTLPLEGLVAELVASFRGGLLREIEEEKRRLGQLDFDDLLLRARDLLRGSRAMRDYFRDRFTALVVDEFQDTDPVQAEIVLRLALGEPQEGENWHLAPFEGSTLFLVGDPKQSIYRFRRADVETYREAKERFPEEDRIPLRTNFRSVPGLLHYVNTLMAPAMVEDPSAPWEIGYAPLEPNPNPDPGRTHAPLEKPVVHLLPGGVPPSPAAGAARADEENGDGEEEDDGEDLALAEKEANAVANLLLGLHGRFPCERWSDVAVVVHRNEAIDRLQEAFRAAGIPAVLEGGRSFFRREETAAVAAALQAIGDPADGVATVAALKSFLFGLSDVELLEAVEAGGRFDDWEKVPAGTPAGEALALLSRLHGERHRRPFAETMADLLASCLAFCSVSAGAVVNGIQGIANLERLSALARDFDREELSFRQAALRLRLRMENDEGEPRAFADEVDAVKLITVHKAKGLEFNVVVLADLGLRTRTRTPRLFYDRSGGEYGVTLKFGGRTVRTPGAGRLLQAFDRRRLEEQKRFLYVGLTRAKEMLVVSWFRPFTSSKGVLTDQIGKTLLAPIASFERPEGPLEEIVELVEADVRPPAAAPAGESAEEAPDTARVAGAMEAAEALLERARSTRSRPLRRAGEKPDGGIPVVRPEDLPVPERDEERRSRAVRIGIAVHETMEQLLSPERALPFDNALAASARDLLPVERSEAARLARRLSGDPIVARALAARRRFVEFPILFRDSLFDGSPLVDGKIDLLFEEDDGWVIVDWKTDRLDSPAIRAERVALYGPQLDAYGRGLGAVLGPSARIKERLLLFARE